MRRTLVLVGLLLVASVAEAQATDGSVAPRFGYGAAPQSAARDGVEAVDEERPPSTPGPTGPGRRFSGVFLNMGPAFLLGSGIVGGAGAALSSLDDASGGERTAWIMGSVSGGLLLIGLAMVIGGELLSDAEDRARGIALGAGPGDLGLSLSVAF